MTIHWSLLPEQPSGNEKRRWRIECQHVNAGGGECSGFIGDDGDLYKFCKVCDRHYAFDEAKGDAE